MTRPALDVGTVTKATSGAVYQATFVSAAPASRRSTAPTEHAAAKG